MWYKKQKANFLEFYSKPKTKSNSFQIPKNLSVIFSLNLGCKQYGSSFSRRRQLDPKQHSIISREHSPVYCNGNAGWSWQWMYWCIPWGHAVGVSEGRRRFDIYWGYTNNMAALSPVWPIHLLLSFIIIGLPELSHVDKVNSLKSTGSGSCDNITGCLESAAVWYTLPLLHCPSPNLAFLPSFSVLRSLPNWAK